MESRTQNQAQGAVQKIASKIKGLFVKPCIDSKLEGEGKAENTAGKVQQKVGEEEKVMEK